MANLDFEGLQYFKGKENAMLASAYSASKTYAVGDYVMSYGVLYKCNTAITVAEAWTPAHWTAVKLAEDVSGVKSAFEDAQDIATATGTDIILNDSLTSSLRALTAEEDCTVTITGRNLISADFTQNQSYKSAPDETICIGKGGYDYSFPSRISNVSRSGDTISFTPISTNVNTAGVGIKFAIRPGHSYRLTYETNGNGTADLTSYTDDEYIGNLKNDAPSGYLWTHSPESTVKFVIVAFVGKTANVEATFSHIMVEELESASEPLADFVPYQKKQTVVISNGSADISDINTYQPETHIYNNENASMTVKYATFSKNYTDNAIETLHNQIVSDIQSKMFVSAYNPLDGWESHAKAFSEMMEDVNELFMLLRW